MNIKYTRKIRQNFMLLPRTENAVYEEKMLEGINRATLLRFGMLYEEGGAYFGYEITSLQPLGRLAEQRGISGKLLKHLILRLDEALFEAEEHMLSKSNLLLIPDTIYIDMVNETVKFCLVPGGSFSFEAQMQELMLFLMRYVMPDDGDAVLLCHRLFVRVCRNEFEISDLTALVFAGKAPGAGRQTVNREQYALPDNLPEEGEDGYAAADGPYTVDQMIHRAEDRESKEAFADTAYEELPVSEEAEGGLGKRIQSGGLPLLQFLLCFVIICAAPGVVVLLRGMEAALRFLPVFCIADICVILYFGISFLEKRRKNADVSEDEAAYEAEYESAYEAERLKPVRTAAEDTGFWKEDETETAQAFVSPDDCSTGELFAGDELAAAGIRRLSPLNKAFPQILLDHFPFVIGKSRIGTDGIIEDARVSRMHAKIQQNGKGYFLTDLNSTNGTKLDGYLLNTNETLPLVPGQELSIAGIGYVFL
ncbi:MAG: DUF6382 domain-containing protein [Eubacteriales bacterium]|nr:DUF6382 domain-containing protein [Eubacteriales bacterium]